jgi:ribonuclease HII
MSAMLRLERLLWDVGYARVGGVDEVGLGPLAGPVVAAAVVFPAGCEALPVDDSKKLTAAKREALDLSIREKALAFGIGLVEVEELDEMGVHKAGLEAMRRAVVATRPQPDYLLVDARTVPHVSMGQSAYVKADTFVHSVAAASIVAKVYRDKLMTDMDSVYPGYGFGRHMGYGTAAHMEALEQLGPCEIHRRSFAPVRRSAGQPVT